MKRGDVVIVDFPFVDGVQGKLRPALVVQNDLDNQRLTNTIVAMISGNVKLAAEPTQVLVDPATPDGASSRLLGVSVIKCNNLFTIRQQDVRRPVGTLSPTLLRLVDDALRSALGT
jgi:mRNA interferase MazF